MNELAAFCHKVENWSARGWYDFPLAKNDPWVGADRLKLNNKYLILIFVL